MKKIGTFLVLLCACLALAGRASAQSEFYTADDYYDVSLYGNTVYTSVVVEGQVNNNTAPPGCQHTYFNDSYLDGAGMYQESEPTRDYVSLENDQQATIASNLDMTLEYNTEVDCSCMGQVYYNFFSIHIVPVLLTINFTQPVHDDDAAQNEYYAYFGSINTGAAASTGSQGGCYVGYEEVGQVYPSGTTVTVPINRTIVSDENWWNQAAAGGTPIGPDPDQDKFTDFDPQSDYSGGVVYAVDGPGGWDPIVILRRRINFLAMVADVEVGSGGLYFEVSEPVYFYARESCQPGGFSLNTDVTGDNQASYGTTPLWWDLSH